MIICKGAPATLPPPRPALSIGIIKTAVAAHFGVAVSDLDSERRDARRAHARAIAMYLTLTMLPHSTSTVGRAFGDRDHSTVISARRRIEHRMTTDETVMRDVQRLRFRLSAATADSDSAILADALVDDLIISIRAALTHQVATDPVGFLARLGQLAGVNAQVRP